MLICTSLRPVEITHCIGCESDPDEEASRDHRRQGRFFEVYLQTEKARDRLLRILRDVEPELTPQAIAVIEDPGTDAWFVHLFACLQHDQQLREIRMLIEEHSSRLAKP